MWNNPLTTSLITAIVPAIIIGLFTKVIFPIFLEALQGKRNKKSSIILLPERTKETLEAERTEQIKENIRKAATFFAIMIGLVSFIIFFPNIRSYFSRPSGEVVEVQPSATPSKDNSESTPQVSATSAIATTQPTPLPTMIPLGDLTLLKADDFSSTSSEWDNYSNSDGATGYEAQKYFIDLDKRILFLSVWGGGGQYNEGVFQVEVLGPLDSRGISRQGIGVGWQTGWTNQVFGATVNYAGQCHIYENIDKNRWRSVVSSQSIQGFDNTKSSYVITVVIDKSNNASVYVDDIFCAKYMLEDYSGGRVGVVALGSAEGGLAYFDNFRIFSTP